MRRLTGALVAAALLTAAASARGADDARLPPPRRTTRHAGTVHVVPAPAPPSGYAPAGARSVAAPVAPTTPRAAPTAPAPTRLVVRPDADAATADVGGDGAEPSETAERDDASEEDDGDDAGPEVTLGLDVVSAYYDRGFLIEAAQAVVQPWASIDARVLTLCGAVRDVRVVADVWTSFQDGESGLRGAPHAPAVWYEGDVWLGAASHVGEHLDVRLDYQWSWSPNGSFERFEEVALQLELDDAPDDDAAGPWRGFAPHAIVAAEVRGQNDEGTTLGWYLELGVEPRWSLLDTGPAVELSLPLRAGLSLHDYYEDAEGDDETFGYVEGGVRLTLGLERLSPCLAGVSAIATVGGIALGEHAAEAGDGRRSRFLAAFSLEWEP